MKSKTAGSIRAFSLVEILIVISVIGVITALAIPKFAGLSDAAEQTVARRNAQSFANVSTNLAALGVKHVIPESLGGKEATCRLLRRGVTVQTGPMKNSYFGMPGLKEDQIEPSAVYLEISHITQRFLQLLYDKEGETTGKKKK